MDEISRRIKMRREALGLTQDELAQRMGYKSRASINKIESESRGLPQRKIIALANALNTTPAYIMGWDEPESESEIENFMLSETESKLLELFRTMPSESQKLYLEIGEKLSGTSTT